MSVHVTSAAWKTHVGNPTAKLVLLRMADISNDDGICWPGVARIARECGISERTVQRMLRELEESGLLEVVGFEDKGRKQPRTYRVITNPQTQVTNHVTSPERGDKSGKSEVTNRAERGDTGVTLTVIEPSIEPSSNNPISPLGFDPGGLDQPMSPDMAMGFSAFWYAYPKKHDKPRTEREYRTAITTKGVNHENLRNRAEAFAKYTANAGTEQRFIPNPANWLRDDGWLNNYDIAEQSAGKRTNGGSGYGDKFARAAAASRPAASAEVEGRAGP
jgi:hypothetical protein